MLISLFLTPLPLSLSPNFGTQMKPLDETASYDLVLFFKTVLLDLTYAFFHLWIKC